ncbi:hypothetical protein UFOVP296_40 [uncultured Caudovirales phage]|uniref:Uncharacterized protein n=1 Tax=uncultured Caudovirales phage TaxID=2100421 RepID=A0A6J5RSE3_9CAUD|nr:hypothetical protein UFOVP296_40 [uncultured Caudovirales phage]CAB4169895.1 hypothetical protein UFOVP912_15 [uncultured Caudovirales phage]CAB4198952.1 hypothetical protein UFOVP1334_3 [uncultured Caudovirales phage]
MNSLIINLEKALSDEELNFDKIEESISALCEVTGHGCVTEHQFTPGLYMRKFSMPAGTILTSKIHDTEHPYVIMSGVVSVWTKEDGTRQFIGPYHGITYPGTRRILFAHTDCVWMTFHATEDTDPDVIESKIIRKKELK